MQALYGNFNAGQDNIGTGEKELLNSINRFYELFLYQLSFLIEIHDFSKRQLEEAKQKQLPSESDLNPNERFIKNMFLEKLAGNKTLSDYFEKRKISWIGENEIVRRVFNNFRGGPEYAKYLSSEENNYENDKNVIVALIRNYIVDFPQLMQFYEEKSIFWIDDIDIANIILLKIVKTSRPDNADKTFSELELFISEEDRDFALSLFRKTILKSEEFGKIIAEKTRNWEMDRIAMMDILLMKMAVCELLEFPSIPVKVSLNEYIDLAKMYSTPKSNLFINGILDKLIDDFKKSNMIKKSGRGLM
ncbi:MAG: transcription antitermination factor NusB [Bacteroidetes bacterium]|nr:transcription antitermination factor NusB [Bacteroidota bacterium]